MIRFSILAYALIGCADHGVPAKTELVDASDTAQPGSNDSDSAEDDVPVDSGENGEGGVDDRHLTNLCST